MASKRWRFCVVGGLAVQRWGEPRLTQDADLTLLTGLGDEDRFANEFLKHFRGRISNAADFAATNRVLLLYATNGTSVDISFGTLAFEFDMMDRTTSFHFADGIVLPTCSAEDLFVMKAFAGRPKDWHDAESVVIRQRGRLDKAYIMRHLSQLSELKEAPDLPVHARKILERKR